MPQIDFLAPIGKDQLFQANLAALAFFHTHNARHIETQFRKDFTRHADLAFAAIDQHQIGQARLLASQLCATCLALCIGHGFVATREDLAHGGIVVAAGDAFDIEAAVIAALHLVMMKDDAGRLGVLSTGVRDVKALNAQLIQVIDRQVQRLGQCARARLLRAFLGQQARQLNIGVLLRHLQPDAALFTRLLHHGNAQTALLGQQRHQLFIDGMADDQRRRHSHAHIVLGYKGFQHLLFHRLGDCRCIHLFLAGIHRACIAQISRKVRPVTQMPPAAHHGQVDTGTPSVHFDGQDIDILVVRGFDGLLVQHA